MHIPVLQKEILDYFEPKANENFIDCTIDGGGHALAILEKILPEGKLLGIDADRQILQEFESKVAKIKIKKNLILFCDNFKNLGKIVEKYKFAEVSGALLDLGMSSWHLEKSGRGFSFKKNEPLDMRYNITLSLTAAKILKEWQESEIEKILIEYGQERFSKQIAREIIKSRETKTIKTTFELLQIIKKAVPLRYRRQKIHPATRTFQALRIAVNDELNNLKKVLPQTLKILKPGGRIAVISFHSLEDRTVKNFFKDNFSKGRLKILTKKPITSSFREKKLNPQARSAKLRVAEKQLTTNN